MRVPPIAACGVLLLSGCGGVAAEDVPAGPAAAGTDAAALLVASCSGCHAEGGAADGIPGLQGLDAAALEASLLAYRDDADGGTSMHRMARGYSEAQIALIARTLGDEAGDRETPGDGP